MCCKNYDTELRTYKLIKKCIEKKNDVINRIFLDQKYKIKLYLDTFVIKYKINKYRNPLQITLMMTSKNFFIFLFNNIQYINYLYQTFMNKMKKCSKKN